MTVTVCDQCGETIGAPHRLLDTDCILAHPDHQERTHGYSCARHFHWINDVLFQIAELFALTAGVLVNVSGPGGDKRSGTRFGSPAPGRIEVMALTDRRVHGLTGADGEIPDVPGALTQWARMVIEEQTESDAPRRTKLLAELDGTVPGSIRLLRRERNWIAEQTWIDLYVEEVTDLHWAVARAVGDTMWPRSIGRCPNCATPMYPTIGLDQADCRRCKSVWTGLALARLRLIHEQEGART